jgi:hypothetical protein
MIETTHRHRSLGLAPAFAVALGVAGLATMFPYAHAQAAEPDPGASIHTPEAYDDDNEPRRRGVQIEGMIGGAGCIPGRAPCRYRDDFLSGYTQPSLGTGATIGWRARSWLLVGAMYRLGMFAPNYDGLDSNLRYAAQHTVAAVFRPILPVWRLDLGLNIAPGYARQVFRYERTRDRDWSQGFSVMVGPTIDVWLGKRFFLGAEVDFIFNTQRRVCVTRGSSELCSNRPERQIAPTHQSLFGLHLGGTIG